MNSATYKKSHPVSSAASINHGESQSDGCWLGKSLEGGARWVGEVLGAGWGEGLSREVLGVIGSWGKFLGLEGLNLVDVLEFGKGSLALYLF